MTTDSITWIGTITSYLNTNKILFVSQVAVKFEYDGQESDCQKYRVYLIAMSVKNNIWNFISII